LERARFDALVTRLQARAQARPRAYRAEVLGVAAVGYAYVGLLVLALLAATAGAVWLALTGNLMVIKLAIALVLLSGVVLRALWVRVPPPEGRPILHDEAPRLFDLLDELRAALATPRFDHVLAVTDFNAAVSEIPQLGVFGFPRHYLLVGVPLLVALTPTQFRAVIAHELAHRSGRHSRLGGWIYRVRQTWVQLLAAFEQRGRSMMGLLDRFVRWYAPRFEAYSFVLAREQEYEADRLAARLTSPRDLGEALVAIEVGARYHERDLVPALDRRVLLEPEPPEGMLRGFAEALRAGPSQPGAVRFLADALRRRTDNLDTHPSLTDRLAALGLPPAAAGPPRPPGETAADVLLGEFHARLVDELDRRWRELVGPRWRDTYRQFAAQRERLAALDAGATAAPLPAAEAKERAFLADQLHGPETALPLLAEAVRVLPGDAELRFVLGRAMLAGEDAGGLAELDRAVALAPRLTLPACELQGAYLAARGDEAGLEAVRERAQREQALLEQARNERQRVDLRDPIAPHGLAPDVVGALVPQLEAFSGVRRAWLARKVVRALPDEPYLLLVVEAHIPFLTTNRDRAVRTLLDQVARGLVFPWPAFVVVVSRRRDRWLKRVRSLGEGSCIYERTH